MAGGHGVCAVGVPTGWVVERVTVQPRGLPAARPIDTTLVLVRERI